MRKYTQNLKKCKADSQGEGREWSVMGEILQTRNEYRKEEWRQIIQECQESGLSNKAYCELHGISEKTYYYWLRKLRRAIMEQAVPQIMEVGPEEKGPAEMLYIRYRGAEMTLPDGTDIDAIASVLRSLQQL
ncbi:IS66 family insertion sequence element accessory protein TnpA [Faecalibaculum rodentium]|uniref:IS66 family insertion sequence element accessory protein TnpA n=1 Tax=Faecalibaculum rodentium TaxID=1702221 RepID=UPI0025B00FE7|nr:transposase [Faecalibaculum rodentium]